MGITMVGESNDIFKKLLYNAKKQTMIAWKICDDIEKLVDRLNSSKNSVVQRTNESMKPVKE
jgi:hypothetical protein